MKIQLAAFIYTLAVVGANPGAADTAAVAMLRDGDMKKLIIHDTPEAVSDTAFQREDNGGDMRLSEFRGKYVLVNFWATWCAPCREEMPQLAALQKEFGGDKFEVVTIATGRNSPQGIAKFFQEAGVSNLPRHQDDRQSLSSQMGVFGLPISVLIDPQGKEIARLRGDADWASPSARAIISELIRPAS